MHLLDAILVAVTATMLQQQVAATAGERPAVFGRRRQLRRQQQQAAAGDHGDQHLLPGATSAESVLPRRQWRKAGRAASHFGEEVQRRFLSSTMTPIKGHWKALRGKLEHQQGWPGTTRYTDETHLTGTTVRRNVPTTLSKP